MAGLIIICLERLFKFASDQWDEYNNTNKAGIFIFIKPNNCNPVFENKDP